MANKSSNKGVKGQVAELAEPIIESLDMELVEVEFVKEGKDWVLRIYIYKKGGVSIDDCVAVNDQISSVLDEQDPIKTPYLLEVSSPGLDRPLKNDRDFERYAGETVDVALYAPDENKKKEYTGTLVGLDDNRNIIIEVADGEKVSFEQKKVSTVKRAIVF